VQTVLDRCGRTSLALVCALIASAAFAAGGARATIVPATTIDGPSATIAGFGGATMAEDGTGGVVYLKKIEGVTHVFASRLVEGHWSAPIRVDGEQKYAASWPRIGAADDGELIVTWATPFATENGKPVDEMLGAVLQPGSTGFGKPQVIDQDVGTGVGLSPDLAVSSSGFADIVYRTVQEGATTVTTLRPGDVAASIKAARLLGEHWQYLGVLNRHPAFALRPPSTENAPQIAINSLGNALVAWQEPEVNGRAQIWARRIYKEHVEYAMPVSTTTFGGREITSDADGISLAYTRLGQGMVAYRQQPDGTAIPGPRVFIATLPDGEAGGSKGPGSGKAFEEAKLADNEFNGGPEAIVGVPSIDLDENNEYRVAYDANGTVRQIEGYELGVFAEDSIAPPLSDVEHGVVTALNPEGGGLTAWPTADGETSAVAVNEEYPEGASQSGIIAGGDGGEVAGLSIGRSGIGDGIVAFRQGPIGDAAIVASVVSAPPHQLIVSVPFTWTSARNVEVSWQPAPTADGPVSYTVYVDGHPQSAPEGAESLRIDPRLLPPGIHHVQVATTDIYGQERLSAAQELKISAPPTLRVNVSGMRALLVVRDRFPGVAASSVHVNFGDGHAASGHALLTHRYRRRGVYWLTASARASQHGPLRTIRVPVEIR